MANFQLGFDGTYTSFSGADAVASFNGIQIGELQAVTVNVQREKGPIYVMGDPNPISFSRGKRGIAGNLVFAMFDRNALITAMESSAIATGQIPIQYTAAGNAGTTTGFNLPTTQAAVGTYTGAPLNSTYNNLSQAVQFAELNQSNGQNNTPFVQLHGSNPGELWDYDDQIPPFDITVTFANEYGSAANLTIERVEILNFGMGISIDDINLENAMTFIARRMQRLRPGFKSTGTASTATTIAVSNSFSNNS